MPISPAIAAVAAPVAGQLIGGVLGPKQGKTTAQLPADLIGPRAQSIQLMQYLLGLGGPPQAPGQLDTRQVFGAGPGEVRPGGLVERTLNKNAQRAGLPPVTQFPRGPAPVSFGGGGFGGPGGFAGPGAGATGRVESIFGGIGVPQTGLQRQATGGIQQFLNQPSPESQTFGALAPGLMDLFGGGGAAGQALQGQLNQQLLPASVMESLTRIASGQGGFSGGPGFDAGAGVGREGTDALRRILAGQPGQGVIDALQPTFQRNLALANQEGGRFGSANAILRGRALEDFNLLGAQAAQRGLDQQMQAAQMLANLGIQQGAAFGGQASTNMQNQLAAINALLGAGQGQANITQNAAQLLGQQQLGSGGLLGNLAGQSGGADFGRLLGAFGIGSQEAQQMDVETQRRIGILLQQLGGMQQATLGAPIQTTPSGAQQGAQLGGSIGSILALMAALGGGGGAGGGGAGGGFTLPFGGGANV